ncbi:hypothetical protein QE379_002436 [Sphingomonas sp. SORGH_AS 879]|nr:hypothetical protein [Sphingomonas sp. SORGH_AS_0879]
MLLDEACGYKIGRVDMQVDGVVVPLTRMRKRL